MELQLMQTIHNAKVQANVVITYIFIQVYMFILHTFALILIKHVCVCISMFMCEYRETFNFQYNI